MVNSRFANRILRSDPLSRTAQFNRLDKIHEKAYGCRTALSIKLEQHHYKSEKHVDLHKLLLYSCLATKDLVKS